MLTRRFIDFLRDEDGSYTAWFLVWFALFFAFGGFAVDIGDAFRVETQLQATADAAALAGVMSLPDKTAAINQALLVATNNMPIERDGEALNGHVAKPSEIKIGHWDVDTETFYEGESASHPANAVYVATRRGDANQNPLSPAFLRILSGMNFSHFDLITVAVAVKYVPKCLRENGLVAANKIDVTSNNTFTGICIHGNNEDLDNGHDYSIDIGNGNTFGTGVQITTPDVTDVVDRPTACTKNDPFCELVQPGYMDTAEAKLVSTPGFFDNFTNLNSGYIPSQMYDVNPVTGVRTLKAGGTIHTDATTYNDKYAGPYKANNIYKITCTNKNGSLQLPKDMDLVDVVIVADCGITGSPGKIQGSVIASSALGSGSKPTLSHTISLSSSSYFGHPDFCTTGLGSSRVYAAASVHLAAQTYISGLHIVTGGDIEVTAQANIAGISAEAGHDIIATANGVFDYCGAAFEDIPFVMRYRLAI